MSLLALILLIVVIATVFVPYEPYDLTTRHRTVSLIAVILAIWLLLIFFGGLHVTPSPRVW